MSAITPAGGDGGRSGRDSGSRRLFAGKGGLLRIVVPVVAAGIAVVALIGSQQPPAYKISDDSLTITAASGETIPFASVTTVELKNTMPPHLVKVLGDRVGTQLRGRFASDGTEMTVYADTAVPPFVYLSTASGLVILNDQTAAKTRSLYTEIRHDATSASR